MTNLLPLLVSFLITVIATPLTIKLAGRFNLVDDPKKRPHPAHIHQIIIPRAGGLPIFLGLIVSISFFIPFSKPVIGLILGSTVLLLTGLLDDYLTDFRPLPRLILQFIAAAIVVGSGVGITFITNPFGGIIRLDEIIYTIYLFGTHNIVLIADIFAFVWIVWMMNMLNWAKGVDGQMPGIAAVAALTVAYVAYQAYLKGDPNQLPIANLAFITAGSALGFLVFNWYPAKILPGFSASTILGFMIASLCILTSAKLATALLVMVVPSVDFFYTFFRRILNKQNPLKGDRKHLHHLLLKRGYTPQQISLFYIFSCAILGLLSINLSSQGKLFITIGIATLVLGAIVCLNFFGLSLKQSESDSG